MALPNYTQMYRPWFAGTPVNAVKGSINIGSGDNGKVIINYDFVGTEGNLFTVQVVEGVGNNIALSAILTGKDILITLGTDGAGALAAAKNTALLIAGAVNALENITAVETGTGADSIAVAIVKTSFTGGKLATPSATPCFIILAGVLYFCDEPVSKWDMAGWKSATPTVI